ncbi:TonB-dependent receptor [Caulobacter sp. KR2-114]|uniref:TonB-dependent receptor n=1 Tax=Caulobacter sp. KR2-114 TaxID=3400912 RepID=UPI003C0321F4
MAGVALASLVAAAPAARAAAAPMPGAPAGTGQAQSAEQIGEVLVTAQKRTERLLDVAAPVTAVGAADLARDSAVKFEDYAFKVPGLNLISDRAGQTQIVMRGITTGSPVSSTVATYVDDTPYGSSTSAALGGELTPDLDPSDIQRVEALRGPQGTLYGASALGGLVKFVTVAPNTRETAGRIEVDGSAVAHGGQGYGVRGMLNIPLVSDTLAVRVSAYDRRDPGFIDDPQLGRRDVNTTRVDGGRVSVLWTPTRQLSVRLTAALQDLKSAATSDEDVNLVGGALVPVAGPLQQIRYTNEPLSIRYRIYSGTANYDLGWASLTSITSYSTLHETALVDETTTFGAIGTAITGIPNFGTSTGSVLRQNKVTQEVRLASPTGQTLEWQGGFFYTHETSNRDEPTFAFDTVTGAQTLPDNALFFANLRSTYTEYAVFGDVTYHFTPKLDLMAGLRYSHNDQTFALAEDGAFVGGPSSQAGVSADHSVTFLVTPRYKFDDNNMVYARIASGYRPGGPNAPTPSDIAAGVPLAYRPDTLTNYEIGYKAALLNHRLTLDLSAFYIDWQDIQIETDFNGITSNGNGGSARSDGVEASATLTPMHGLTLSGNLAYTDAQLTEDAPGVNGRNGDALPNVPKWAASLNVDYDFPITASLAGFVGGSVRYLGDRPSGFVTGSPSGFVRPTLLAYATVDLRAGVSHDRLSFTLWIKNVGDTRGLNNVTSLALSGYSNPFTASVIQPRTVGLSVSAGF